MKCRWKHCKHGGEVDKDEAVKVGSSYFHKDCYEERTSIQKVIDLYRERVDSTPIENWLRKTVNELVLKQGVDARFLLFAFQYCLDHGWNLHTPAGLKYVAKNTDAKREWSKQQVKKELQEMKTTANDEFEMDTASSFVYTPQKAVGFEDILMRKEG